MKLNKLSKSKVLIFGYGIEGKALYAILKKYYPNTTIMVVSDKFEPDIPEYIEHAQALRAVDNHTVLVKSQGIPYHHDFIKACKDKGIVITTLTNIFMAEKKGINMIIGITGTKGKSTTVSLLTHVLNKVGKKAIAVGNIGDPAINYLNEFKDTIFVYEFASYQTGDLQIAPDIGIILNIYADHMDYHGDAATYHEAKFRMIRLMSQDDHFFYHPDYSQLVKLAKEVKATSQSFPNLADKIVEHLPIKGSHIAENTRSIIAVTRLLNIADQLALQAMQDFQPLPHRSEVIAEINGITFINDSIATVPQASIAGMRANKDRLGAVILGGMDRGYDFASLTDEIARYPGLKVYLLPGADIMAEVLAEHDITFTQFNTMDDIIKQAILDLKPGQICLLSPGSPSYNIYRDYKQRGDDFRRSIEKLS